MSNTTSTKTKQKKSKSKLDRLLLIKKNIMDSLNMLSKNDRSSAQVERNNTVPKGNGRGRARYLQQSDGPAIADLPESDVLPRPACNTHMYSDQIRKPPFGHYHPPGDPSAPVNPQCALQSTYQTWPYGLYFERPFQDQYSYQPTYDACKYPSLRQYANQESEKGRPAGQDQSIATKTQWSGCNDPDPNPKNRSMKHQEIQTESTQIGGRDLSAVNADLVRYLNQFNDKLAFDVHAPAHLRQSGGFFPFVGEYSDRFWYSQQAPTDRHPNRWVMRKPKEYFTSNNKRECYANYYHNPKATSINFQQDRNKTRGGFEKTKLAAPNIAANDHYHLAPPRPDTRASSDDSGSIFSSETDSDFVFYPCTSLTQSFHCMTLLDSMSRNTSFLSPPLDMPENVNTNFSWRSDFYGSSLDDVTLQFFLDEDALSDDVFMDEPVNHHSPKTKLNNEDKLSHEHRSPSRQARYDSLGEMTHMLDHVSYFGGMNEVGVRESYGDNCYAYRYADIDEVLQDFKASPQESTQQNPSQHDIDSPSIPASKTDKEPTPEDAHVYCDYDDTHLELSHEFANVFDSLRRNSTQSKARKMWRQRRAKYKKYPTNTSVSHETSPQSQKPPSCQPSIFTFDHINTPDHRTQCPVPQKPLRGILKNKNCNKSPIKLEIDRHGSSHTEVRRVAKDKVSAVKTPVKLELEQPLSNHTEVRCVAEDKVSAVSSLTQVQSVNTMSNSASSCIYDEEGQIVSPSIIISKADQMAMKCTDLTLQQTPMHDRPCADKVSLPIDVETTGGVNTAVAASTADRTGRAIDDSLSLQTGSEVNVHEDQDKETTSPSEVPDQFHFILSPTSDGSGEIISVRKNSLDIHRWTQSLQRRHKKLTKKTRGRAHRHSDGLKSSDNNCIADDTACKVSPATI